MGTSVEQQETPEFFILLPSNDGCTMRYMGDSDVPAWYYFSQRVQCWTSEFDRGPQSQTDTHHLASDECRGSALDANSSRSPSQSEVEDAVSDVNAIRRRLLRRSTAGDEFGDATAVTAASTIETTPLETSTDGARWRVEATQSRPALCAADHSGGNQAIAATELGRDTCDSQSHAQEPAGSHWLSGHPMPSDGGEVNGTEVTLLLQAACAAVKLRYETAG